MKECVFSLVDILVSTSKISEVTFDFGASAYWPSLAMLTSNRLNTLKLCTLKKYDN